LRKRIELMEVGFDVLLKTGVIDPILLKNEREEE
jgi:hypothetical protein